jgi:hypothetical protein
MEGRELMLSRKKGYLFDVTKKPPMAEWLEKEKLQNMRPTNEFRLNGTVLEQKWQGSEFAYHSRWVPIRKKRGDEK